MNKSLAILFFFLFCSFAIQAQNNLVFGYLKSDEGEYLVGATVYNTQSEKGSVTDGRGYYEIEVTDQGPVKLKYNYFGFEERSKLVSFSDGETRKRVNITLKRKVSDIKEAVITGEKEREKVPSIVKLDPKDFQALPSVGGGAVEDLLKLTGSASSNNELSSQYNVRGGNFDENIVYVNDFEIFRPFLVRSGQQEGLSFINPDLVRSVRFSAGGFEAKYGDKLSSVLDVEYRRPKDFGASAEIGLLGYRLHAEGTNKSRSLKYIAGFRQKSNKYLLNALPTQGQYQPLFRDFQIFTTYQPIEKWEFQFIANYSQNEFIFRPESETIRFGNIADTKQIRTAFEGQENDNYESIMAGIGTTYFDEERKLSLKLQASLYRSVEEENFDIIGEYFIGEVETDLGQENFAEVVSEYGVGTYHDYARNDLDATIFNIGHKGNWQKKDHFLSWGLKFQHEEINDEINEWNRVDSAGYSLQFSEEEVNLFSVLKTELQLASNRYTAYVQDLWNVGGANSRTSVLAGMRIGYWDVNKEFFANPRLTLSYAPKMKMQTNALGKLVESEKELILRLSTGLYYQPPFYREMRDRQGQINRDLKAQKSLHVVGSMDYYFPMWGRPFKFTTEAYYKHLWDLVPYDIDNVLIRYNAKNNAKGYAAGIEFRVNGEFVEGSESWFSLGLLQTEEDILDDFYWAFYDSEGTEVEQDASSVVDSARIEPGFLARPTDQRINFSIFFQDHLSNNENIRAHLGLQFGSRLPYGPPGQVRNRNAFRSPFYTRVDIGFSALLFDRKTKEIPESSFLNKFERIWASLEVFNLLGISNTVSYSWINDFNGRFYSVPNRLTSRRINARIQFRF